MSPIHIRLLVVIGIYAGTIAGYACPPLGPVLLAPKSPSGSKAVPSAINALKDVLGSLTGNIQGSGVSIGIKSIHEEAPLLDFHFTPPKLDPRSTKKIDSSTIYRLASVSKVFPVLAILQRAEISLEDPITKYLPELLQSEKGGDDDNAITSYDWSRITLGALASHLGGVASDMALDLAIFPGPWTDMGLPSFPPQDGPKCSGLPGTEPCTSDDLLKNLKKRHPLSQPYTTPAYSNIGIALLGLVVEAVTGKSFEDAIRDTILRPAGMVNTTVAAPAVDAWAVIPIGDSLWRKDTGVFGSAGGMHSNTKDMLAFGKAILTSQLTSKMNQWLKPATHTSSIGFSVGAPWEILRSDNLTSDGRVIDIYTKAGDLGLHHGIFCLVPDYDIVISILTAGPEASQPSFPMIILSQILKGLLPAIEKAGKEEANAAFAGSYTDPCTNSTLVLSQDSGPGLVITNWTIRNFDVLPNIPNYSLSTAANGKPVEVGARLYPTNLQTANQTAWRAVFSIGSDEDREKLESQIFYPQGRCLTWGTIDRAVYNYAALDDFVFTLGSDGRAVSITPRAFGVVLKRK